jgi:LAO/AO transport system kinase
VPRRRLTAEAYIEGVRANDRATLARAITLAESDHPEDTALAATVLDALLPHTGNSRRVGVTGVPGAGKSTFIDRLGMYLIRHRNERVAVLSVDPSSPVSGGSILGDKTRMERLAAEEDAFIRPSPSGGHPGGVARRTREVMLLCEAAGYRNILIETVGVGQSETAVRSMTDFFLLLMLPGAGDELQGIKRGILEMADALAIHKADGDNLDRARRARGDYASALHLFPPSPDGWAPPVLLASSLTGEGIPEIWQTVLAHEENLRAKGRFEERRASQSLAWLRELIALGLEEEFRRAVATVPHYERLVREGRTTPLAAARQLLEEFRRRT